MSNATIFCWLVLFVSIYLLLQLNIKKPLSLSTCVIISIIMSSLLLIVIREWKLVFYDCSRKNEFI